MSELKMVTLPGGDCPVPVMQDSSLQELVKKSLEVKVQMEYDGEDPRYEGMSFADAALQSLIDDSTVDPKARKELIDRMIGKATQHVESTNLNVNLVGMLDQLAIQDKAIFDVTPLTPESENQSPDDYVEEMFK